MSQAAIKDHAEHLLAEATQIEAELKELLAQLDDAQKTLALTREIGNTKLIEAQEQHIAQLEQVCIHRSQTAQMLHQEAQAMFATLVA